MLHCQDCIKCFVTSHARDQHCDAKRHNLPEHECDTCGAHFGSKEARQQHMSAKLHGHGGSSFECYLCSAVFAAKGQYTDHMAQAHLCCTVCDRTFVDSNSIKQHLNATTHRGNSSRGSTAPKVVVQPRGGRSFVAYTAAARSYAAGWWAYTCPLCPRRLGTLGSLNQHLNSQAHEQLVYCCPKDGCRGEFGSLAAVLGHVGTEACDVMRVEAV